MGKPTTGVERALPETVRKAQAAGLSVIPQYYKQGRKKPAIDWKEFQERRASLEELKIMNHRWPNAMWCFVCGQISGLVVLGFDGPAGRSALERLGLRPSVLTPRGGRHVYVRAPEYRVRSAGQGIPGFPGMEVLGEAHLATFYGKNEVGEYRKARGAKVYSMHELPEEVRKLIADQRIEERELRPVELPPGFTDFAGKGQLLSEALAKVDDGEARNVTGFWLACQLRDERYSYDEAAQVVLDQYQPLVEDRERPYYDQQEARHSVVSAYSSPPRAPRGLRSQEEQLKAEKDRIRLRRRADREVREEEAIAGLRWPESRPNLADELAIEEPPLPYTIAQLHPTGSNTLLAGKYKSGKSTLMLNLLRSLVDGKLFLGMYPVGRLTGKVAYWNGELTERQWRQWAREADLASPERAAGPLHLRGFRLPLEVPAIQERAARWLSENEVELWILDPFAKVFDGEENSNTDVGRWCEAVDEIKRLAGVKDVVVVAHFGRQALAEGEEHVRGATRLDDWADNRWLLTKDKEGVRYFEAEGRDSTVPSSMLGFRREDRYLGIAGGTRAEERVERGIQWVCEFVRDRPGATARAIQTMKQGHKDDRLGWRDQAVLRGYIHVEQGSRNSQLHSLTDQGREFLSLRTPEGEWRVEGG